MPKLKQPASLQDMAMGRLVRFCSQLCVRVSRTGDLDRLHRIVLFIKGYAAPHIPSQLHAEFYNSILRILWSDEIDSELARHPVSHQEIVLEMIMDQKITGLDCEFPPLPLCLSKVERIQGLTRLTIEKQEILRSLEKFNLDDLRDLDMESRLHDMRCTDEDLKMIAQKCPMLEELTICVLDHVTDAGLHALAPCSNLRSLFFDFYHHSMYNYNSSVTLSAIDQFLSATGRKREMPVCWCKPEFDNSETLVYRFIESLTVDNFTITSEHLHSIVAKFPNLRHFCIGNDAYVRDYSDLHVLSGLDKLSALEIMFDCSNVMWTVLVPLFRRIGANMRTFAIPFLNCCFDQDKLNLMYELCPNVENVDLPTCCENSILVVPQFKNLAYLRCWNHTSRRDGVLQFAIDDGAMLKLKELIVLGFDMDQKIVEMILDHQSFPNLERITIEDEKPTRRLNRFRSIAKKNNLDLEFDHEGWYET